MARGKKHVSNFNKAVKIFEHKAAYAQVAEPDPEDSNFLLHKIKFKPVPSVVEDIASDAIYNLRAALDHAVYASAVVSGNTKPKHAAFPFKRCLTQLKASGKR
jgi:hypothetical protein